MCPAAGYSVRPNSAKRCHSEPVRAAKQVPLGYTLAWESVSPRLPLRGRCQREALTEGEMPRVFLSPSRLRRQPPPRGGLTARRYRADGTSYPKGICSAALHGRTPSPTRGSTYRPVGRGPCAPPSLAWESVSPRLPLRGRCQREALTEGEMPHVFLSPSRLRRRQPPPRGGLTARRCRAVGTSYPKGICSAALHGRTPSPTESQGARACGRTESSAPLQRKKRRLPPSLFIQLYCRTTAVTLPSRVA